MENLSLILVPLIALIVAQVLKLIIEAAKGNLNWSNLYGYGGMPSAHSATVAALVTQIYLTTKQVVPALAVAIVFSFFLIREAVGLRQHVSKLSVMVNRLIENLPESKESRFASLPERLGHTFPQVLVGILMGVLVSVLYQLL